MHICIGYLYIYLYTTYNSFMIGRIIHEFAHFHLFIPLKVACIFECSFSHVHIYILNIYAVYLTYCRTRSQFISIKILQLANGLFSIEIFSFRFFCSMQLCVECGVESE